MTAAPMTRIVPVIALVGACGIAGVFGLYLLRRQPPADPMPVASVPSAVTPAAPTAPAAPAAAAQDQTAVLAGAQKAVGSLATALTGPGAPTETGDGLPSFDIARIEPNGEAVIAGRAAPGATVELLRNGQLHDRIVADQAGQFAMVPPRLPAGNYELTLRSRKADGQQLTSKQSVAVALERGANEAPVVALMAPNKPTVVLSQPGAAKPVAGAVAVETVEIAPDGKFHVSGRARPGVAMRFYLNDSFVAPVTAAADGRFAITINEGVAAGNYRVRLDEVEATSGTVRARAEVPFNVPKSVVAATPPATASRQAEPARAQVASAGSSPPPTAGSPPAPVAATPATASPSTPVAAPPSTPAAATPATPASASPSVPPATSPSVVVVPKIVTTTVSRGDNLWNISQSTYGAGIRYAVIYDANKDQIRNPHMIYPGQVFVLPTQ